MRLINRKLSQKNESFSHKPRRRIFGLFSYILRRRSGILAKHYNGLAFLNYFVKSFINRSPSKAFTLAEVLITLGTIGIVAEMTIPTLINNIGDQANKTAYKKAYSIASQAFLMANNDGNMVPMPTWTDTPSRITNFKAFKSYFKVIVDCSTGSNLSTCWASGENYYINSPDSTAYAFIDASGMSWATGSSTGACGAEILVDTNGFKSPNKLGQDRFVFSPNTIDGNYPGSLVKIGPLGDCLDTTAANCMNKSYTLFCPSVATHPCYFTSWLYG